MKVPEFIRKYFLFLLIFTLLFLPCLAQPISVLNLSERIRKIDDLSNIEVNCMFQDSGGIIWFGTIAGLCRYNGNGVTFFRTQQNDTTLNNITINCISQYDERHLLLGTDRGISVFDKVTEKYIAFTSIEKGLADSTKNSKIFGLYSLNNFLVVKTFDQLFVLNKMANTIKPIFPNEQYNNKYIHHATIVLNENKLLCELPNENHGVLDLKTGLFQLIPYENINKVNNLFSSGIEGFCNISMYYIDNSDNLFILYSNSVTGQILKNEEIFFTKCKGGIRTVKFNYFLDTKHSYNQSEPLLENMSIKSIVQTSSNDYIVLSYTHDLHYISLNNEHQITSIKTYYEFSKYKFTNVCKDRDNNIYFLGQKGAYYWPSTTHFLKTTYLPGLNISSITPLDSLNGYVGSINSSLLKFQIKETHKFQINKLSENEDPFTGICLLNDSTIIGLGINTFLMFKNNKLVKINDSITKEKFRNLFRLFSINNLTKTKNKTYWTSNHRGINKVDAETGGITAVANHEWRETDLYYDDNDSCLWSAIGGWNNYDDPPEIDLIKLNYFTEKSEYFVVPGITDPTTIGFRLTSILKDLHDNIWISTTDRGIYLYNFRKNTTRQFTINNGLPSNQINSMHLKDSTIWFLFPDGLGRINISSNTFECKVIKTRNVYLNESLTNIPFDARNITSFENYLFISGDSVLLRLDMSFFNNTKCEQNILLTKLMVNNMSFTTSDSNTLTNKSINYSDTLFLKYNQNKIEIGFSLPYYSFPEKISYAYKLDGLDTSWTYCESRQNATFSNLDPGEYIFRIKASINEGEYFGPERILHILISPPFYKTNWFYMMSCIFLVFSITGLYKWRTRALRQAKKTLEKQVQQRTEEIVLEKQKSDDLLLNILPVEVMEELKSTGRTQARNYDLVTVLFADFEDFTSIIEQMPPEELVSGIDEYFETFDRIIENYPVEKIKTVGDAYICAAGLPQTTLDNPVIMLDAAFEMLNAIDKLKQKRAVEGKVVFSVRIGAHSGPLVAGVVGIKKFAYDIWGDTVNTAARMQQHGEPGKINISGTTYNLVKHRFNCTYRGRLEAKHKGETDMYFVDGRK